MHGVSIFSVRALLTALEQRGLERDAILRKTGLRLELLTDEHARISYEQYRALVRDALALSADPAFGLHMGEALSTSWFEVLGPLAQLAPNLRSAIELVNAYALIATEAPRFAIRERETSACILFTYPHVEQAEYRVFAELAVAGLLHAVRLFIGAKAVVRAACFSYPAPVEVAEYARVFANQARFDQSFTGIEIERSWLERAPLHYSPELHSVLRARADLLLERVEHQRPVAERVKTWLASREHLELRPTMTEAARALGFSTRTLHRRLKREMTTFTDMTEEARVARATRMLSSGHYSVQDVSYDLGFATPAAFSRAFKRWTGKPPRELRPRP